MDEFSSDFTPLEMRRFITVFLEYIDSILETDMSGNIIENYDAAADLTFNGFSTMGGRLTRLVTGSRFHTDYGYLRLSRPHVGASEPITGTSSRPTQLTPNNNIFRFGTGDVSGNTFNPSQFIINPFNIQGNQDDDLNTILTNNITSMLTDVNPFPIGNTDTIIELEEGEVDDAVSEANDTTTPESLPDLTGNENILVVNGIDANAVERIDDIINRFYDSPEEID